MSYILPTLRAARRPLRREIADWQRGALGLLALSIAANAGLYGLLGREEDRRIPWSCVRRFGEDIILVEQ